MPELAGRPLVIVSGGRKGQFTSMARDRKGESSGGAAAAAAMLDLTQTLAIADALPMAIAFVDTQLRYRLVNKALAEFLGWPREEMLGKTMGEVLDPEVMAARKPMLDAALAGERQWFAADFEHPERGPLALQSDYLPQRDGQGNVFGIVLLINDVTEQRTTERALKESEARFRRIADSAPAMMWVTRLDRTRDFVNDAYTEFVGLSREEARAFDWRLAIHPDDVDRLVAESVAGEASLKQFTLEGRYRRHDGEYRWLSSVSQPRFGPDGELVGFIGVASDITVTKEAELELRRQVAERTAQVSASEARFRSIFDTVMEVLVLLKPDGTILELNRKSAPWRDPNHNNAVGRKLWEAPTMLAYPEHIPLIKRAIKRASTGKLFNAEVKMEREGTPTAHLDVSMQPVRDAAGTIAYLLFEARDITELKRIDRMKTEFVSTVSHDLRYPLTTMRGYATMLEMAGELNEQQKSYTKMIVQGVDNMAKLVNNLLDLGRIDFGVGLQVESIPVLDIVERVTSSLQYQAPQFNRIRSVHHHNGDRRRRSPCVR